MTANSKESYVSYLNKLIGEYINTYHLSIRKKSVNTDYSTLSEKIESSSKLAKFKVGYRARIAKYKQIFSRDYTADWSRKIFLIDSVLKANPWAYKDLNGERN